ncbi:MAG: hypothetical protein HYY96_03015 [Candidatus Tectomicrobia bacterium]|nr:hypothetical protein [Candidatus Tectomicrobia bacterium]
MKKLLSGVEAMGEAAALANVQIAAVYPITPQSEVIDVLLRHPHIRVLRASSEYNVMALLSGAAWRGARVFTASASHGLAYMTEMWWEVAGSRLPIVMGVFNRGVRGPCWNFGSHQNDSLLLRDVGWLQFYCESVQEIIDFILIAYRLAEEVLMPVLVVGDGFFLSHSREIVELPEPGDLRRFLPAAPPETYQPHNAGTDGFGGLAPARTFFDFHQHLHEETVALPHMVLGELFHEFAAVSGRRYELVEAYRADGAETIIVATGIIAGTVRATLEEEGGADLAKVGLLKLRALRPFPIDDIIRHSASAQRLIVLDRNISVGCGGVFATELASRLYLRGGKGPRLYSVIAGLGGENVDAAMLRRIIRRARASTGEGGDLWFERDEHVS